MRGKVQYLIILDTLIRITPAYAGKRSAWFLRSPLKWDHPRLCGEKTLTDSGWTIPTGSPPPMRGKVIIPIICWICSRITPAYAGKRLAEIDKSSYSKDHPRLCGEKGKITLKNGNILGSPPPMRGKAIAFPS